MRFAAYEASAVEPNVVVDGSPNEGTVLTISHWPGMDSPAHLAADTSAAMVVRYLESGVPAVDADVVTNNHFDQDGLAGVFALLDPDDGWRRRELLVALATAGDFGVVTQRAAARLSMAISALTDADRSGLPADTYAGGYPATCAALYEHALPRLACWLDDVDTLRPLWAEEDADLTRSLDDLARGRAGIVEHTDIDLAVVTIEAGTTTPGGHRFAGRRAAGLHPMAVLTVTDCSRLLAVDGRRYRYTDRYESWVQYASRPVPRRIDLRLVADELTAAEPARTAWTAAGPSDLAPELATADGSESSLAPDDVLAIIRRHLLTDRPAWDPFTRGA